MLDKEKVISALHCRAQDLMIDLPACDGCDYQIQMVNHMGCNYRQLCKDAIAILKDQETVVRCWECKHCNQESIAKNMVWCELHRFARQKNHFCADGEK